MLSIDIVKDEPRTELEAWQRWKNRMQSEMMVLHSDRKVIEVKQPEEITCSGAGRAICERNGEHSWFNHSQDGLRGELPTGYKELS